MKKTIILFALPLALLFATDKDSKDNKTNRADKQKTTTGAPTELPASAVKSSPYTWRYTDAQGKKWIYRQTPFGLVKYEDTPEQATPASTETKNPTTVTDLGDSVRFERNTPFGKQNWTKKKTELDEDEQALLKKSQEKE